MITISLNDVLVTIEDNCSVEALLLAQQFEKNKVAVAVNGNFVPRSQYGATLLQAADQVDVLTAVQGG